MSSQLSLEEISRVGQLARLQLSDEEKIQLTGHLNDILQQFGRLQELDTTGVPPTSHSLPLQNVLRDDVAGPSLPRDAATLNAPDKRDGNFIVPQIMEG